MDKFENLHDEPRNLNVEWAMLKELALGDRLSVSAELDLEEAERVKYRRRGKMLLEIVGRMPDKLDDDEKVAKIDKIHRAAEKAGLKEGLDQSLDNKRSGLAYNQIGKWTFDDDAELTAEELERVEALRERVVDMTEIEPGALAEMFPSGNYLYHGSTTQKIEKIFQTGGLKNGVALVEDDPGISALNMNSGFEGLSWSMNGIDALPGTRGHIAGFLAAPEDVLGGGTHLVVPSRPAPYEVLQVDSRINPKELYGTKNQLETWGDGGISLGEKNSVDSNLTRMLMYKKGDLFLGDSKVYDYDGDLSAEELRKYYTVDEDGKFAWDEDVYQKSEMPPALPWMQLLIDRGVFSRNGIEGLDSVEKVVERAKENPDFIRTLIATERQTSKPIQERYEKMLDDASAVRVGTEQMHFVTSHQDLEAWLKVMARTGVTPKSILLYDDDQVVMENFASDYEGNHKELSQEIGQAVGANTDFWKTEMNLDPDNTPRSGSKGQVLLESAVNRDKIIQLGEGGKLETVSVANFDE